MTTTPKVLAFSGSLRKESFNHKLAAVATKHLEAAGAEVRLIRLSDYPLPLFDEDVEARGYPDTLEPLKDHFRWADGLLISTPEYNSSFSAAMKNAIDWVSRPNIASEPPLVAFRGKTAGLLAASPGGLGGIRVLPSVRMLLSNIGVHVIPNQHGLGSAHEAFNDDGSLKDPKMDEAVKGVAQALVTATRQLAT